MEIRIGEQTFQVERVGLRKWFECEGIRSKLSMAAERGEDLQVANLLVSYLSAASSIPDDVWEKASWLDVSQAYIDLCFLNAPKIAFPILRVDTVSKKEKEEVAWDYPERTWYQWLHLIAASYGWNKSDIESLDIDEGIALVQEIQVDKQMQREWEYSLSEVAYGYNPATKKSEFHKLERPGWMVGEKKVKLTKIRRDMLPIGAITNLSGMALHGELHGEPVL